MDAGASEFVPGLSGVFNTEGGGSGGVLECYAFHWDAEPKTAAADPDMARYEKLGQEALAAISLEGAAAAGTAGGGGEWAGEEHESQGDKAFRKFRKRVARAPTQVLRYCWDGAPLWQGGAGQPRRVLRYCWDGAPLWQGAAGQPRACGPCPRCQGPRVYEMQAMPALLHYLDVEGAAPQGDMGMDCAVAAVAPYTLNPEN
ncbi:hypothetical protein T484DRAFT_1802606 [Baffinella frigidus]|nr:hypothetical protein T484DRAFT_1802606 [Cryptophyta sp. CCMP2293]